MKFLLHIGFDASQPDHSLFILNHAGSIIYVLVYVDNILISRSSKSIVNWFTNQLHGAFPLCDIGDLSYFLGIHVTRDHEIMFLA